MLEAGNKIERWPEGLSVIVNGLDYNRRLPRVILDIIPEYFGITSQKLPQFLKNSMRYLLVNFIRHCSICKNIAATDRNQVQVYNHMYVYHKSVKMHNCQTNIRQLRTRERETARAL